MSKHGVYINERSLLVLTELISLFHVNLLFMGTNLTLVKCTGYRLAVNESTLNMLKKDLEEALRHLLREPLRNSNFREHFNLYFSLHSSHDIQEFALPWMNKVLVWED